MFQEKISILFESQSYNILPKETSRFSWHDCNGHFLESQLLHYAGMMDILGHEENIISLKDRSFVGHIFWLMFKKNIN